MRVWRSYAPENIRKHASMAFWILPNQRFSLDGFIARNVQNPPRSFPSLSSNTTVSCPSKLSAWRTRQSVEVCHAHVWSVQRGFSKLHLHSFTCRCTSTGQGSRRQILLPSIQRKLLFNVVRRSSRDQTGRGLDEALHEAGGIIRLAVFAAVLSDVWMNSFPRFEAGPRIGAGVLVSQGSLILRH